LKDGQKSLIVFLIFSERELTFTFAISYRPPVCRLSVVCNTRAPYRGGSNFRQYFFGIRYLGHPLTSTKKFHGDRPRGTPPPGELNTRGVAKYSDFGSIDGYISKRCKIGGKLVLITNRKSYMSFPLVPKSVTLNDLERRNGRYFALFQRIRVASGCTA